MPYGGSYRNGGTNVFDTGPSGFEALVGNLLQTVAQQRAAKKQQDQETQQRGAEMGAKQADLNEQMTRNALVGQLMLAKTPEEKEALKAKLVQHGVGTSSVVEQAFAPPKEPVPVKHNWQRIENKQTGKVSFYDPETSTSQADVADEGVVTPKAEAPVVREGSDGKTYQFDPTSKSWVPAKGIGFKAPGGPVPDKPTVATESERRGAGLLHVLSQADDRVKAIEQGLSTKDIALNRGGLIGRFFQSPEAKQYDDDLNTIVASYLYVVSGATANPGEVKNQVAALRINEGDDPKTIDVKVQRRQDMLDAVRTVAGRAAEPKKTVDLPAARARAQAAIQQGADPAKVAARFQQKYGQAL